MTIELALVNAFTFVNDSTYDVLDTKRWRMKYAKWALAHHTQNVARCDMPTSVWRYKFVNYLADCFKAAQYRYLQFEYRRYLARKVNSNNTSEFNNRQLRALGFVA